MEATPTKIDSSAVVVGSGLTFGSGVVVGPRASVASSLPDDVTVGARSAIAAGVVVGPSVELADDVVVGRGTIIGAGSRFGADSHVGVSVVFGEGVAVAAGARVCDNCHIGADVSVGRSAYVQAGVTIAADRDVPPFASIPHNCHVVHRGDVVVVGPVGSEGVGRWVTICRQPNNQARIVAGCWNTDQGGTPDDLEARIQGTGDATHLPWATHPLRGLFVAQYTGVIATARQLAIHWSTTQRQENN